jgi:hypothetical protein
MVVQDLNFLVQSNGVMKISIFKVHEILERLRRAAKSENKDPKTFHTECPIQIQSGSSLTWPSGKTQNRRAETEWERGTGTANS